MTRHSASESALASALREALSSRAPSSPSASPGPSTANTTSLPDAVERELFTSPLATMRRWSAGSPARKGYDLAGDFRQRDALIKLASSAAQAPTNRPDRRRR